MADAIVAIRETVSMQMMTGVTVETCGDAEACPECGSFAVHHCGRCASCVACGWSLCSYSPAPNA